MCRIRNEPNTDILDLKLLLPGIIAYVLKNVDYGVLKNGHLIMAAGMQVMNHYIIRLNCSSVAAQNAGKGNN